MKSLSNPILLLVLSGLIVLGGVRLVTLFGSVPTIGDYVQKQAEAVRPARLEVVVIADGTCPTCTSTQPFLEALQQQRVVFSTIKQIDGTTEEGKSFIAAQKIERFPAVIISGEVSHHSELEQFLIQTSSKNDGTFIYFVPPPYHEVASDKVRGLFHTTYLVPTNCSSCYDVTNNAIALKNLGVTVTDDRVLTADSAEGKQLIKDFKIRYLPTVILVGDLEVYSSFQNVWPQVGSTEQAGTYVLREGVKLMGTYYDLELKQVVTPKSNISS